jgi:hypothetical protein
MKKKRPKRPVIASKFGRGFDEMRRRTLGGVGGGGLIVLYRRWEKAVKRLAKHLESHTRVIFMLT